VHHGLDDHGVFENQRQAQQMVTSAGDIEPSPQMRCVAIARIPFIDQA
jgi:hypothetical protein